MADAGVLNNRETAVAIWAIVAIVGMLFVPGVPGGIAGVVRAFFAPKIIGIVVAAGLYSAALVLLLDRAGFWDRSMAKGTVIWFCGTAFIALMNTERKDTAFFRRVVDAGVKIIVLITFITNMYVFPLYVELVLAPFTIFVVILQTVAAMDAELATVRKLLDGLVVVIGATVLLFSLVHVASSLSDVVTRDTLRLFLLPMILTVLFIPFLYAVAIVSTYEGLLIRVRSGLRHRAGLYPFARRGIFRACGLNLGRVNRFAETHALPFFEADSEEDVLSILTSFRQSVHEREAA
jgi:hypothetical protein